MPSLSSSGARPYLAKLADAVYVLHCFRKKTEKTSKRDLDLATRRFRDLMQELKP